MHPLRTTSLQVCSHVHRAYSYNLLSDSPSGLVWVPSETLGRTLNSCQLVLEGGTVTASNQDLYQSALQTTIGVLDSILYLTSRDI